MFEPFYDVSELHSETYMLDKPEIKIFFTKSPVNFPKKRFTTINEEFKYTAESVDLIPLTINAKTLDGNYMTVCRIVEISRLNNMRVTVLEDK